MRRALSTAVTAALLLAGCGDDSGDQETAKSEGVAAETTPATTAAEAATTTTSAEAAEPTPATAAGPLSKAEYEARFRELNDESEAKIAEIQEEASGAAPDDLEAAAEAFRSFAGLIDEISIELDAIEPPEDIAAEHQGYAEVLRRTGEAYTEVADEIAGADDAEAAEAALGGLNEFFGDPEVAKAARAFANAVERGGYDVGVDVQPGGAFPGATAP